MRKKISQRHAKWMQKRITELERERSDQGNRWKSDWSPRWVRIDTLNLFDEAIARVQTARALVLVPQSDEGKNKVAIYAEKI
jgi:hypothetical protein